MNRLRTALLGCTWLLVIAAVGGGARARAQEVPKGSANTQAQTELDPHLKPAMRPFESAEHFFLELRGGPYSVFSGQPYGNFFQGDKGPNLNALLEGIMFRMPGVFYATVGGSVGLLNFSGDAQAKLTGDAVSEQTTLNIIPLTAVGTIHLDVLPRRLGIPVLFAARLGWEWARWTTSTGSRSDANGWALGPVFSAQVAIDLDSFEPGGARALDEEWGINHTYLFGELFHFTTLPNSLPIGTTSWLVGLGFVF